MEIGERVAVGRDDDAGAAALAVAVEDGDRRPADPLDRGDAIGLGGEHGCPATCDRFGGESHDAQRAMAMQEGSERSICAEGESLHDSRVAQIEPVARVEVLAVVDDDFEPFHAGDVEVERQRGVGAGDRWLRSAVGRRRRS